MKYIGFLSKIAFLTLLPSLLLAQDLVQARPVKSNESFFDDLRTGESNLPGYVALDGRDLARDMMGNVTSASKIKAETSSNQSFRCIEDS